MTIPKHYYGCLLIITCLALLTAPIGAGDDEAAGSLLGGKKLIIGLPKKVNWVQFMDLQLNSRDKKQVVKATGYSIDVFEAAIAFLKSLGYNISFEYRAFVDDDGKSAGDNDALIYQIFEGKYDAVVGDVSIVANRSNYVDFTLPYMPSDVKMLVKVRHDPRLNMWNFIKPFSWDLWLSIVIFNTLIGGVILFMERAVEENSITENSPPRKQVIKFSMILWLPVIQAVLPERESVSKACSRFVLVLWLILVFVLMQSYTACLSSILTVHQLQPSYPSEKHVINDPNIYIGYPGTSFLGGIFVGHMKIDSWRMKKFYTVKQYKEALDKGSHRGGIDAYFNEVPYLKLFLKEYGSNYALVNTRHRNDGYGFAFPKGSNLTSYFSRAILNVRESEEMDLIEQKYFGSNINNDDEGQDQSNAPSDNASPSLTAYSFAGLFMVIGMLSLLALLVSERRVWINSIVDLVKTCSQQLLRFYR